MVIIWRGLGFLVLVVVIAIMFGAQYFTQHSFGDAYWEQKAWPAAAGLAAAGAVCWFLGRKLNKPARKDANPRRPWTHDLLFLRMEWWAFPLAALAVAAVALNFTPGRTLQSAKAEVKAVAK
jgi:hypothetical protein